MPSLLSLGPLPLSDIEALVERSVKFATRGIGEERPLAGKTVGIFFRRSSTRTRTSFTVGAMKLGAHTISYGPEDLQLATGETYGDTGRVLSGYLDALVTRTNDAQTEMEALAESGTIPIINAMSAEEHPTQAIADLSTIHEHFGHLEGIDLLYLGEGNNTTSALALAFAKLPDSRLTIATPEGYGLASDFIAKVGLEASRNGSTIAQTHDVRGLPDDVDVVYTTRWNTMGVPKPDPDWREKFAPFTVTARMMRNLTRSTGTVFMHDLPAVRGQDVTDEVLDGPQSLAWRQAEHKMFSAMAVLEWCIGEC